MLRLRGNDIEKAAPIQPLKHPAVPKSRESACLTRLLITLVSVVVVLWFLFMSTIMYRLNLTARVEHKDDFGYLFKHVSMDIERAEYKDTNQQGVPFSSVSMQHVIQNSWPNPDQQTSVVMFAPEADYDVKAIAQFQETLRSVCLQTVQFGDLWILKQSHTINEVVRVSIPVEGCTKQAQLVQYTTDSFWTSQLATVRTHFTLLINQNGLVMPDDYLANLMAVSAYFNNETLAVLGSFGYLLPVKESSLSLKQPIIPVPHPSKLSIDFKTVDLLSDVWFYKTAEVGPCFLDSAWTPTMTRISKTKKRSSVGHRFKAASSHVSPVFKLWGMLANSGVHMPTFITMPLKTVQQHVSITRISWHEILRNELIVTLPMVPVSLVSEFVLVAYQYQVDDKVKEIDTLKKVGVLLSSLREAGRKVMVYVEYPAFAQKQRRLHCRIVAIYLGFPLSACTSPWLQFQFAKQSGRLQQFVKQLKPIATFASSELALDGIPVLKNDWKHMPLFAKLSIEALSSWSIPVIQVDVITYNRPDSLTRLVTSIQGANYLGDSIQLTFHQEAHADVKTRNIVEGFKWPQKQIVRRSQKAGLAIAVLESWYPTNDDHYAVILEDDVELSPLFYIWLKVNLLKYRYGTTKSNLYGISLYTPNVDEMKFPESPLIKPSEQQFLYQIPCSWGALYFPNVWRGYLDYLEIREPFTYVKSMQGDKQVTKLKKEVVIPGARSNYWLSSWKKFFIEYVYSNGLLMLYPNFGTSFSTNHLEGGEHILNAKLRAEKLTMYRVDLMADVNAKVVHSETSKAFYEDDWQASVIKFQGSELQDLQLIEYDQLPVLNLFGKASTLEDIKQTADNFNPNL